jgi:DNA-binding transcriptional LysR family regulator
VKLVAADLERLGEERPDLSIELISGVRAVDLEAGQADLAVRSGAITDKQLIVRAIGDAGFSLYASDAYLARHPQSFDSKDLRGHAVIGYASSVAALPPASWIEAHAAGATIVLRNREIADMVDAAMSGIGIALLPCMLGDLEPSLRRLTPEVIAKSRFSLVYPREARRSEALRTVVRWLLRSLERHAVLIRGEPSRASSTLTPPERNSR